MGRLYQTTIEIAAAISRSFRGDALAAAGAMGKLAASSKQLKDAEKSAAAFSKLQDTISKSKAKYDQASEALRRLKAAELAAGGATKESAQWVKAGERAVAAAAREMDRSSKAAERNAKALRDMGVNAKDAAKAQQQLAAAGRFAAARERLFGTPGAKTPLVQKAGEQFRGVARDAAILAAAATGAGVALSGLVLKTLHSGDEIGDTAEKLGIGTTALQELRYGARQSGAEVGALDVALKKMAISIGHFKNAKSKAGGGGAFDIPGLQSLDKAGGGAAAALANPYKMIGLNAKQLAGLKPEEQFKAIADGFSKLKTHADKAAAAQLIFGKGATEMLPLLASGSKGIEDWAKKAHQFGGVLSDDAVVAADLADKAMRDAEMAFAGVSNTLGAALLPTATKVFKEFSEWVAANRGEIKRWAETAARWIEDKGIPALKRIAAEAKALGEKAAWLVGGAAKLAGGFGNLAIAVGALRLAPLVLTLSKIGIEGVKAASAMLKFAAASGEAAAASGGANAGGMGMLGALGLAATAAVAEKQAENAVLGSQASTWQQIMGAVGFDTGGANVGGMSAQDILDLKDPAKAREFLQRQQLATGGGGAKVEINMGDVVVPGGTKSDVRKKLHEGADRAADEYDQRVSFAH